MDITRTIRRNVAVVQGRAVAAGQPLAALLAVVLALLVAVFGATTWLDHAATLEDGWQAAERGALGVAEHADRAFAVGRMATDRVAEAVRRDGVGRFQGEGWHDLGAMARDAPQIGSLWVIDAAGLVAAETLSPDRPAVSVVDRPYFAPLRDGAEVYLMPLFQGSVTGIWFFSVNRAIRDREGRFAGIVQAAMHADDFHRFYNGLGLGPAARVGLFRREDVAPLMLWPLDAPADSTPRVGGLLPPAVPPETMPLRQAVAAPEKAGRFDAMDAAGVPLLAAWRQLGEGGGLIATAAVSRPQALAPFHARLWRHAGLLLLAMTLVGALGRAVRRSLRREAMAWRAAGQVRREIAAVLETIGDGVLVVDAEWRVAHVNRRGGEWLGRDRVVVGQRLWDAFPESAGAPFRTAFHRSMAERLRMTAEGPCARLGRHFVAESLPREAGGLVIFFRDVTAERAAAAAIAESEARLRQVVEQAPIPVMVHAETGQVLHLSRTWTRLTGYRPEDIPTVAEWMRRAYGTQPQRAQAAIRAAFARPAGEPFEGGEFRIRTAGGEERIWLFRATRAGNGGRGARLLVSMALDVTEARAAERALAESEARFREMADSAPVMIRVADPDGQASFLSRSWCRFTGRGAEAGLGMGWLDSIHPEDQERVRGAVLAVAGSEEGVQVEYRLRRADGEWAWALDAMAPRRDAEGALLGHIGSVIDITERKEAEERQLLLAREVDHRAKNALAVVQSILGLTRIEDPVEFRKAVAGRVAAMARAQTLLARDRWDGAELRALVEEELAAFHTAEGPPPRVAIEGPPVALAAGAAQPFAMALHEMATNAAKYGGLSGPGGRVSITWARAEAGGLHLRWVERGGPPVPGPPPQRGFGSAVIATTVERQLRGSARLTWAPEGLEVELVLPAALVRWPPAVASAEAGSIAALCPTEPPPGR